MIDKGYTKLAYRKMSKLMPKEFQIQDLGPRGNTGMLRRGVDYGIIVKVRTGWYKVADGITDPWKSYSEIATKIRAMGNPGGKIKGLGSKRDLALVVKSQRFPGPGPIPSHPPPLQIGERDRVSIMSFSEHQDLIRIGKKLWLAVEVALVPKGGQQHG